MQVLENIDKPFLEIADNYVSIMNIWEVSEINIDIDGTPIYCTIKDDKDKAVESDFKVNGQDANVVDSGDDSYFRTFYQSVVSIFIENIEVNATPAYDPDIIMDCRMKVSSDSVKIGFVKRGCKNLLCCSRMAYIKAISSTAAIFIPKPKGLKASFRHTRSLRMQWTIK